VVVDKFGNPSMYQSYQSYSPVQQFTNPRATPAIAIGAIPGGQVSASDVNEEGQATNAVAEEGLGVGAYVGIGVVGFLCLLLLCVLIYCGTTRSRNNNLEYNVKNNVYDPNAQTSNAMWGMPANNPDNFGSFGRQNTGAFGNGTANAGGFAAAAPVGAFGMFGASANGSMDGSELGRHGNTRQNFGAFGTQGNMQPSYGSGTVNNIPNPSGVMSQRDRFITAADLPSPAGPLRKDTENAAYGLSSPGPSTTFVGGDDNYPQQYGTQYQANGFSCRQCGKAYNYQSDLDAHKQARGHSDDLNGF